MADPRTGGYVIRRATAADHEAVARELSAYLAFLGETLDGEGLDKDIAQWEATYDGARGGCSSSWVQQAESSARPGSGCSPPAWAS